MAYKGIIRKKMKKNGRSGIHFIAGTIAALLVLSVVSMVIPSVRATELPAHNFHGYVRLNGELVVDGTNVSVWENESGVWVLRATTWTYTSGDQKQGNYSIDAPPAPPSEPENGFEEGDIVNFTIDGIKADQTGTWSSGSATYLDLWANGTSSIGDLHHPEIKATSGATWNATGNKWEAAEGATVTMKANVTIDLPSVAGACTYRNVTIKVVYNKSWWGSPTDLSVDGGSPPTNWGITTSSTSGTTDGAYYVEATISYHSTGSTVAGSADASVTFNTTAPSDASDDGNGITFAVSCSSGYEGSTIWTGAACDSTIGDAIPEFSTLLIPVIGMIFLFFIMRKKYKK